MRPDNARACDVLSFAASATRHAEIHCTGKVRYINEIDVESLELTEAQVGINIIGRMSAVIAG